MFRTITIAAAVAIAAALLVHYLAFRLGRAKRETGLLELYRYSAIERLVHAGALAAFAVTAATGFWAVALDAPRLAGWPKLVHVGAGTALGVFVAAMGLLWAADAVFAKVDWPWLKALGGHFTRKDPPHAERFDAGQKIFVWVTVALALTAMVSGMLRISLSLPRDIERPALVVHQYSALLFVLCAAVHAYCATLAKPGTLGAMVHGRVRKSWAKRHHLLWYKRIG